MTAEQRCCCWFLFSSHVNDVPYPTLLTAIVTVHIGLKISQQQLCCYAKFISLDNINQNCVCNCKKSTCFILIKDLGHTPHTRQKKWTTEQQYMHTSATRSSLRMRTFTQVRVFNFDILWKSCCYWILAWCNCAQWYTIRTDVIIIQTQNDFCCFPSVTFEPVHYLLNFRAFYINSWGKALQQLETVSIAEPLPNR